MKKEYVPYNKLNIDKDAPDALERLREAEQMYREFIKNDPDKINYKSDLCMVLGIMGYIYKESDPDTALVYLDEAETIADELYEKTKHPDVRHSTAMLKVFKGLAKMKRNDADFFSCFEESVAILAELEQQYPDNEKYWKTHFWIRTCTIGIKNKYNL